MIVLAVCWYLRFGLSYRDVEELLARRGIEVDHVTIYRWVQRFTPLLADAARPCRHAVGDRWQVDETYVKVAGQWRYVYRASRSTSVSLSAHTTRSISFRTDGQRGAYPRPGSIGASGDPLGCRRGGAPR